MLRTRIAEFRRIYTVPVLNGNHFARVESFWIICVPNAFEGIDLNSVIVRERFSIERGSSTGRFDASGSIGVRIDCVLLLLMMMTMMMRIERGKKFRKDASEMKRKYYIAT